MAKKFTEKGLLQYETFTEHTDLDQWLKNIIPTQGQFPKIWEYLHSSGRYFEATLQQYPKGICTPDQVQRGRCHMNNFLYAKNLFEKHQDILHHFQFVTGIWLRKMKEDFNGNDQRYAIGCHSFMTFKGDVLDCTVLHNTPHFFEVTQRFGIPFSIPDTLTVFEHLKATNSLSKIAVLEAFYGTPYLK